jgi:hypothetical protein
MGGYWGDRALGLCVFAFLIAHQVQRGQEEYANPLKFQEKIWLAVDTQ